MGEAGPEQYGRWLTAVPPAALGIYGVDAVALYVRAARDAWHSETLFRVYAAEALRVIGENTARAVPGGRSLARRYADLLPRGVPADGAQVAKNVLKKAGIRQKQEGSL